MESTAEAVIDFGNDEELDGDDLGIEGDMNSGHMGLWRGIRPSMTALYLKMAARMQYLSGSGTI